MAPHRLRILVVVVVVDVVVFRLNVAFKNISVISAQSDIILHCS